jgi:hypothetical protein
MTYPVHDPSVSLFKMQTTITDPMKTALTFTLWVGPLIFALTLLRKYTSCQKHMLLFLQLHLQLVTTG